jgi:hypothetical protein
MKLRLLLCAVGLCVMTGTAQAVPITFSLASSLLTTQPGFAVTFTGTLTETGGTTTFLNGDSFTTALPLNDTPFLTNFPLALSPLQSMTAPMFIVTVPSGTLPGLYSGIFSVLGGATPTAVGVLGSQQFAVSVVGAPIPEPAPVWLLITGGGVLAILRGVRRRAGQQVDS